MARALEVPLYQLFYDGDKPAKLPNLPNRKTEADLLWGNSGKDAQLLTTFRLFLSRMEESNRLMLLFMAHNMVKAKGA
jgi:hypothetical protein